MNSTQRHKLIERAIAERQFVSSAELASALGASPATIRRDMAALERAGRLHRVWGGVEAVPAPPVAQRPPFLQTPEFEATSRRNHERKRAIARAAAALCQPGESVIINGGTTTYCLGEFVAGMGLQVLTNNFALAVYLVSNGNCRVVLPGGDVYREQSMVVSPYERDTMIDHFYASTLFIGAQAIRPQGLIEGDPLLIKAEQKLIRQADRIVALVDGSKFVPRSSFIVCPLHQLGHVVTDDSAPAEALEMLAKADIPTTVVSVEDGAGEAA
jgi:DeoR family ulaG and ulaABCDEF operon transcriptional repressor